MRLPGENEERNSGMSIKYMAVGVALCFLLILGVVFLTNREKEEGRKKNAEAQTVVMALEHEQQGETGTNKTADGASGAGNGGMGSGTNGAPTGDTAADGTSADNGTSTGGTAVNGTAADGTSTDNGTSTGGAAADGMTTDNGAPTESTAADGTAGTEQSTGGATVAGFGGRKSLQDMERLYQENKLTASDLDFWDMYPENEPAAESAADRYAEEAAREETSGETSGSPADDESEGTAKGKTARYEEKAQKELEEEPSRDGKHTRITYADGTEEWVLINPYLERNTYDFTKLSMKADKMAYYEDGKKNSYLGADISKYNNEVDFSAMKEAGIDYVMIRLGARGYGSGQILLDERFGENITKAAEAGMDIGIYFFSQAVTKDEAVEEANFVIQNLANHKITYPVVFDMELVENDKARIEALSREEKTTAAKAFLDTVKSAGYKPMLYGTKEWLIKQVDLTKLTGYDIWLSQQEDVPDYPYKFQMWQYTTEGDVSGVDGDVDLNVSFVDYAEK